MRNLNSVEVNAVAGGKIIYYGDLLKKNSTTIIGRLEFLPNIPKDEQEKVYKLFKEIFLKGKTKGDVGNNYEFKAHIADVDQKDL